MFGYIKGQTVLGCQSMQKAEELTKVEVFSLPAKQIKQRILNYQRSKSNAQVDGEPARQGGQRVVIPVWIDAITCLVQRVFLQGAW